MLVIRAKRLILSTPRVCRDAVALGQPRNRRRGALSGLRGCERATQRQTAAQAQSTDALANQAGRGGVMGMPGQGMATAGAPVKERDQNKGPTVANGAGKGGAESTGAIAGFNSLGGLAQARPSRQHITYVSHF